MALTGGKTIIQRFNLGAERNEHERTADVLKQFERHFGELFDGIPLIAIILNQRGDLTFCNEYLLHLTGWQRKDIVGGNWRDRFVPPEQHPSQLFRSQLAEGLIPPRHENEIVGRDGIRWLISWNNSILIDETGQPVGTASVGQDITEPSSGIDTPLFSVPLTPRERVTLRLLAGGKASKEVAVALNVSVRTAEAHRANLMRKLNLHSSTELLRFAIRHHLVKI